MRYKVLKKMNNDSYQVIAKTEKVDDILQFIEKEQLQEKQKKVINILKEMGGIPIEIVTENEPYVITIYADYFDLMKKELEEYFNKMSKIIPHRKLYLTIDKRSNFIIVKQYQKDKNKRMVSVYSIKYNNENYNYLKRFIEKWNKMVNVYKENKLDFVT